MPVLCSTCHSPGDFHPLPFNANDKGGVGRGLVLEGMGVGQGSGGGSGRRCAGGLRRYGGNRSRGSCLGCVFFGAEAELDQSPGVRSELGLPAVIRLVLLHGGFGGGVPLAGGRTAEVVLADEGFL